MTTTLQDHSNSQFLYPVITLSGHSTILSFSSSSVETTLGFTPSSEKISTENKNNSSSTCYRTLSKYSCEEYKRAYDTMTPIDAKSFFAKAYGKKDMFSKEIKIEKFIPRPVSVNLEETLLQVSHDTTTTSPSTVKKSTTLTLFGGLDEDDGDERPISTPATLPPPQPSSTFSGFDAFDSFSSPPPKTSNSNSFFDAFETPSSKPSASLFDSFDTPLAPPATNSAFSGFDSFDTSFSSQVNAPPTPKECSLTHSLTCFEELLCLYKNYVIDKFQLTGAVQYQFNLTTTESNLTPEGGTSLVANIQIQDESKKLLEILPQSSSVTMHSAATGNSIQAALPWDDKFLKEQTTLNLIKYLVTPTYRPEYMRTRMNISHRAEQSQNYLVVAIQLMLNKNYPNITYENIQVMCSLTSLTDIQGEVKTRPNGLYTTQSKVVTWRCGNQSAGKQGLFQMEASIPLRDMPLPLPTSLPVIVKALMTDTPIVADCTFSLQQINFMKDGNISNSLRLSSTSNTLPVGYKSKIEYRFL